MKNTLFIIIFCMYIISCTKSDSNIKNSISQEEIDYQQKEKIFEEKSIIDISIDIDKKIPGLFPGIEFLESYFYTLNLYGERKYNINTWGLLFFSDNTYRFRPLKEGDPPYIEGSFQIIDNKILLKYIGIPYGSDYLYMFDDILKEDWELEYTAINDSLYFSEGLIGKSIIFGQKKSQPKDGEIRTVNGYEIVIQRSPLFAEYDYENHQLIDHRAKLNVNSKVRTGPGTNFQHCTFEWYGGDEWYVITSITDSLPEGFSVQTIGHTKEKYTINGMSGYWYYCHIPFSPDTGGNIIEPAENNCGWIFGPLIDFK